MGLFEQPAKEGAMNPLDLPGPSFLWFYAVYAAVVLLLLRWVQRAGDEAQVSLLEASDPYRIAYLRGGSAEAARVATLSLLDRELLTGDESGTLTARRKAATGVRRPIEEAVVSCFRGSLPATASVSDPAVRAACETYRTQLERGGFLPDDQARNARRLRFIAALLLLGGMAGAKIVVALSRGRFNIGFLIALCVVAIFLGYMACFPRQTAKGQAALANLQKMFASLKARAAEIRPGGAATDLAMLAAVFGFGAIPAVLAGQYPAMLMRGGQGSDGWSSCGTSSCSGDSSCGCGGCGGGGCGGG
jgi:uncharacterized protein (TIGR04222 family)